MKNIILCGSMKVKNDILNICKLLQNMKYNVLLPTECMQGIEKTIASRAHFDRICDEKNDTILVVNSKKDNIDNYIGPNTFAEIALGFYFNKDIYLLNDDTYFMAAFVGEDDLVDKNKIVYFKVTEENNEPFVDLITSQKIITLLTNKLAEDVKNDAK